MRVKYIPVFTDNIDEQLNFFTCNLGFKVSENRLIYEDVECKTIETGSPDTFFVLVKRKASHDVKNCIILNTDDCLNDYHRLKTGGVVFFAELQDAVSNTKEKIIKTGIFIKKIVLEDTKNHFRLLK